MGITKRGLLLLLAIGSGLTVLACTPQPDPGADTGTEQNSLEQEADITEDKTDPDEESPGNQSQDRPEEAKKDRIRSDATFRHEVNIETDGEIREGEGDRWWEDDSKNGEENKFWDND